MTAAHCMNQLCQSRWRFPGLQEIPRRNTWDRAVWTAENGSSRDSSEAVQTAVNQDGFFQVCDQAAVPGSRLQTVNQVSRCSLIS
jgi:hypothetical protein